MEAKKLVKMIATECEPFSVVDGKRFFEICQAMNPRYQVISRKYITKKLLHEWYSVNKKVIGVI